MDPIHPIVPVAPNIPPIAPAPMTGRIERDSARESLDDRGRRRRRRQPDNGTDAPHDPRTTGATTRATPAFASI